MTTAATTPPRTSRQPSKKIRRQVRDAFDFDKLAHICTTWDFTDYARRVDLKDGSDGRKRFFYYMDNGSDVLAIAHLDTVQNERTCTMMNTIAGPLVASGGLDDRLGAYVILELLPKLGITCDWLLTTDEEIGASTAAAFDPTHKKYNWMFQFDRGGTDVVMYEYETGELCDLVEDAGARVGQGSFSDICLLDHLGCAGFNWGVGYRDYHSARSHAWLDDTFKMVARFVKFYTANAATVLAHVDNWGTDLVIANCGHTIDLDDDRSYVELGNYDIVCSMCAADEPRSTRDRVREAFGALMTGERVA